MNLNVIFQLIGAAGILLFGAAMILWFRELHYRHCPKCKRRLRMLTLEDMTAILTEHTESNRHKARMAACVYGMAKGPIFACSHCRAWWSSEATR